MTQYKSFTCFRARAKRLVKIFEEKRLLLSPMIIRNQIAICVLFGFIGFMYAVLILVYPNEKSEALYGELRIENMNEQIDKLLNLRIADLQITLDSLQKLEKSLHEQIKTKSTDAVLKADEGILIQRIKQLQQVIEKSRNERYQLIYRSADTSMRYLATYIYLPKEELTSALNALDWNDHLGTSKEIHAFITDTCKLLRQPSGLKRVVLTVKQHKNEKLMSFVADYPIFGFWIVITIGQMMLWFLLCPMLAGNLLNLKDTLGIDCYSLGFRQRCINVGLPLLFVGVFCASFYLYLADNYVITDFYFFASYNDRMLIYAIPGYLLAAYCFTSYLTLATQFNNLDKAADSDPGLLSDHQFGKKFTSLRKAFDNTFLFSAIILSLMILWVGVLINALNGTDAFRFYATIAGKPFIPGDYVYLMALMHTIILLTFYLPVRLQFSTMEITQPNALTQSGTPVKNMFEIIMSNFGSILVTVSPLIAGFVQDILQAFFAN